MQRTIIISGASGLVATELASNLLRETTHQLILLTRNKATLIDRYCGYGERVRLFSMDELADMRLIDGENYVCIHTAFARSSEGWAIAESIDYTRKLAEICRDLQISKFINISSQSVYGDDYISGVPELAKCNPSYLYALGKYSTEVICSLVFESVATRLYNIRLSSVCENARFMKVFVDNAINGRPINIVAPNQTVSFIDVRDVASALIAVVSADAEEGIYNLGSGNWYTIGEVAQTVTKVGQEFYNVGSVDIDINDNGNSTKLGMSIEKFSRTFHWKPEYQIDDMVKSLYEMLLNVNGGGIL